MSAAALTAACVAAAVLVGSGGSGPGLRRLGRHPRRRSARPARPRGADVPLMLELVAAALQAGAPPPAALAVVAEAIGGPDGEALAAVAGRLRLGSADDAAWAGAPTWTSGLRRCLALSQRTGAPAAPLLRDRAAEVRRRRHRAAEAAAARLGVRVVLPLGLCALPGFAAWGVVPVVLGLAGQVLTP